MTVYVVDLESIPTRYTCEWKDYFPALIKQAGKKVAVISGPDNLPSNTTPGMFLNFSATNIYKSVQVEKISRLFQEQKVKNGDYFLFTDAWHPGVINLRYMASLLGVDIKIGGLWHAGSYDPHDGLGQKIGDAAWVRHAEKSFFHAYDHNYFATNFHIDMFLDNLLSTGTDEGRNRYLNKIIRTGWPMEYSADALVQYKGMDKRNLILFPHRVSPEKQDIIFRELKHMLPQYEFIVCQDQELTKNEYHNLLGQAKIVFSASLQETLGIGCYEGAMLDALPLVPDRLSYTEMYSSCFKYPSNWTLNAEQFRLHAVELCQVITSMMDNYEEYLPQLEKQKLTLTEQFFSANELLTYL